MTRSASSGQVHRVTLYRPVEGRRALKPDGEPLAAAGETIALDRYWRRLFAAGDIEAVPVSRPKSKTRHRTRSDEGSQSA